MSAPTQTQPRPASRGGVDIRLPWWALALPIAGFVVLLALILHPTDAQAAGGDPAITSVVTHLQQLGPR